MTESAIFAHYLTVSATVVIPSISVALGQGKASQALLDAINRQPAAKDALNRMFFVAMALTETAGVLSALIGVMLFMAPQPTELGVIAQAGAALAVALPAFFIGLVSSLPTRQAFLAVARQPLMGQQIMNLLLISLSIIQTPVVFGLVISWLIQQQILGVLLFTESLKFLATGLALAIGSIGPTIGLALFAQQSCKSTGTHPKSYNSILSFTFLSQAMIETPILFALVISLFLYFTPLPDQISWYSGLVYILAACAMGLATFGPGISSGRTAGAACKEIGKNTSQYSTLSRVSIITQTFIDTNAIYCLIIALLMLLTLS